MRDAPDRVAGRSVPRGVRRELLVLPPPPREPVTGGQPPPEIDTSLLAGFAFVCRPDCGLCCYAEPLVAPEEKPGLLRIVPEAEFVSRGRFEHLRAHPDGGACVLLAGHRCRAHAARPAPCREYPLAGYVGARLQANVVLTCPGVELSVLDGYEGPTRGAPPHGFDSELAALRSRIDGRLSRRLEESRRRRGRIARTLAEQGRWVDEEEVRRQLRGALPVPSDDFFPVENPPSPEDGLELLPLVFDARPGPVAFARRPGGWELLELRPTGGVERSLGAAPPPDHLPELSTGARRTLAGYLRYWLERDQLFGTVLLEMLERAQGSVTSEVVAELQRIAATAISRAYVLAAVRQRKVGPLSADDLSEGIRATDQDLLDRPAWGSRF